MNESNFTHSNPNCNIHAFKQHYDNCGTFELQKLDAQKRDHDKIKVDSCISALHAITS